MGTFMLVIAVVVATHPPNPNATHASPAGIAAIAMVYCEAASFNLSWGPVAWYESPKLLFRFSNTDTAIFHKI